jgi:cation:H+ antiporter
MITQFLILLLSLALLYFGAEFSLESAEKVGRRFKLSPLIIGMFLVGIGTSLPEFFVSHISALKNQPELALGTVIGSNIGNVYFILALSSLFTSFNFSTIELRQQLWAHLIVSLLVTPFLLMQKIDMVMGIVLGIFLVIYLYRTFAEMKQQVQDEVTPVDLTESNTALMVFKMFLGFFLLYLGGDYLVSSASVICESFGIPAYVISAILVALGTSFPELITSLLAIYKKKGADLIIGNILGSNIFNIALILGSVAPYKIPVSRVMHMEIALLLFCSLYFLFLHYKRVRFVKTTGILFLAMYIKTVTVWFNS